MINVVKLGSKESLKVISVTTDTVRFEKKGRLE